MGNIDGYPTNKGGKFTEVVVYANYIGLRRFYRYVVNILMKVVNLIGFTVYIYIYIYIYIVLIFLQL